MDAADPRWDELRQEMCLEAGTIYLNSGSYSPISKPVATRLAQWREKLAASPADFFLRDTGPALETARDRLAAFLHFDPAALLLVPNATFGMNLIIRSLDLPAGSEILLSDQEYGAVTYTWHEYAQQRGWTLRTVPTPLPLAEAEPAALVAAFAQAIGPATRVLSFSHVSSPTGLVFPAAELVALAQARGLLSVIDGAHAPAMVPLDLQALGADYYTGNCHKWMMGPTGTAFLAVRHDLRAGLKPLIVSWGYGYPPGAEDEPYDWSPSRRWAFNLEFHGTRDRGPCLVLPEVLDFLDRLGGVAGLRRRVEYLRGVACQRLESAGLRCVGARHPDHWGSLTLFAVPPVDPWKARHWVWRHHRIEVPFTQWNGQSFLRVSTAWFNTPAELAALATAIQEVPWAEVA